MVMMLNKHRLVFPLNLIKMHMTVQKKRKTLYFRVYNVYNYITDGAGKWGVYLQNSYFM